jgi:Pvc16 N-terminal domain
MIYEALSCITEEVNEYFKSKLNINEDKIVLSGIVNQDGTVAAQGENKILLSLLNIEKESIGKSNAGREGALTTPNTSPAVNINLCVLFSAYFGGANYGEALRFLSFIIGYLQNKSVFTRSNTPKMDERIGKLILEMENLGIDKLNNVWATIGAKYMPSVMYKIRMLVFDDAVIREFRPPIAGIGNENIPAK